MSAEKIANELSDQFRKELLTVLPDTRIAYAQELAIAYRRITGERSRDVRLMVAGLIVGRRIESFKDLTRLEAAAFNKMLLNPVSIAKIVQLSSLLHEAMDEPGREEDEKKVGGEV